jgi:hypothetical protein
MGREASDVGTHPDQARLPVGTEPGRRGFAPPDAPPDARTRCCYCFKPLGNAWYEEDTTGRRYCDPDHARADGCSV